MIEDHLETGTEKAQSAVFHLTGYFSVCLQQHLYIWKERILALILKIYTNIFFMGSIAPETYIKKTKERSYNDSWFLFPVSMQKVSTVPSILFLNLGVSVVTIISD